MKVVRVLKLAAPSLTMALVHATLAGYANFAGSTAGSGNQSISALTCGPATSARGRGHLRDANAECGRGAAYGPVLPDDVLAGAAAGIVRSSSRSDIHAFCVAGNLGWEHDENER